MGLWSALFAGGLGAVSAGIALGIHPDAALGVVTVAVGALLLVLERLRPEQPDWLASDGQWWNDIAHLFLGFTLGTFGGAFLAQTLFAKPVWAVWPTGWPLLVQVLLAMIIAEFFLYWQHRAVHTVPGLWHLHALHHSTERMTFFKTTRIHALDIGSATLFSLAPLFALGAPASVLLWVTAFGNIAAQTQHANVQLRTPGWLNAVVVTPAVHWLHHSRAMREGNSNFGMNLMIWDRIFGTFIPPPASPGYPLGIEHDDVPTSLLGQLVLPWQVVRALTRRR